MALEPHRHDISDRAWEKIRPYTIGEKGKGGGNACVSGPLGGRCQKYMETGRMYTVGFAGGVTRESGKRFRKPWWMTQTLNGG